MSTTNTNNKKKRPAKSPPSVVDLTQDDESKKQDCSKVAGKPPVPEQHESVHDSLLEDYEEEDDNDNNNERTVLIASSSAVIVGIRYYDGVAHPGEFVSLVREPNNPYDANAIRVDNLQGIKVGHIKKQIAQILAPFLDRSETGTEGKLIVEATIPYRGNAYTLPCELQFLVQGSDDNDDDGGSAALETLAAQWAAALKNAFHNSYKFKVHHGNNNNKDKDNKAGVSVETKTMKWDLQAQQLDDMFDKQAAEQLDKLPDVILPPNTLKTPLKDYQEQGLKWLVHQESVPKMPFFTPQQEKGKSVWHCSITNASQVQEPQGFRGGILADEMGLGKTLQMLGLMLASPPAAEMESPRCTLLVMPVGVMSNWEQQIQDHVQEGVLNLGFYQGNARTNLLDEIQTGDLNVVMVSYHTLAAEYRKIHKKDATNDKNNGGGKTPAKKRAKKRAKLTSIFDCDFHRIILDEAHMVRSCRTTFFKACVEIKARNKWALTGTPFVNRADDIYSLVHFVGVEPLCDKKIYQRVITYPIENGNEAGLACLRLVMSHVALRRSKDTANISLVPKTVELSTVSFQEGTPHKMVYDALFGTVRTAFEAVLQNGENEVLKNYSNIFEKLLRLRQASCSSKLVPLERRQRAIELWQELQKSQAGSDKKLTAQEGLELLEKLKGTFESSDDNNNATAELPECCVCLMEMDENECVILKTCGHVYCEACIMRVCTNFNSNCPLCRKAFSKADMIKKTVASTAAEQPEEQDNNSSQQISIHDEDTGISPKTEALLDSIQQMKPDEKGVIFSSFTSHLDLIQEALKDAGHSFTRLDGSMPSAKRMVAVQNFSSEDPESPRFILCSLHAAGTGINLTRGSWAFMMDCWWNAAVENQAMDRIHRLNQTRPVRVVRFVMQGIEERIVALQEAKSLQAKAAMQKLKPEEQRRARLNDLKGLLEIE